MNQLTVDELFVSNCALSMINAHALIVCREPLFSSISLDLVEGQIDCLVILWLAKNFEANNMTVDFAEVFFGLSGC